MHSLQLGWQMKPKTALPQAATWGLLQWVWTHTMANFTALNSTFTACMDNLSFIETVRRVKRNHHRVILIRPSVKPAAPLIDRCSSTGSCNPWCFTPSKSSHWCGRLNHVCGVGAFWIIFNGSFGEQHSSILLVCYLALYPAGHALSWIHA